jgi:DNA-binding NarL/FixJ family response regulator
MRASDHLDHSRQEPSQNVVSDHRVSALIVARPGRRRNGLRALLRTIPRLGIVGQVDEGSAAMEMVTQEHSALVLLDSSLPSEEMWMAFKQIKAAWPQTQCIVIADNIQQQRVAHAQGADGVLLEGFAAETLFMTIDELLMCIDKPDEQ